MLRKAIGAFVLSVTLFTSAAALGSDASLIPAGTHLPIRLSTSLSSKSNQAGDGFSGKVDHPVVSSTGAEIVPVDSTIKGHVILAGRATYSRSGTLKLCVDSVTTPDGTIYEIPEDAQRLTSAVDFQAPDNQRGSQNAAHNSGGPALDSGAAAAIQVMVVHKDAVLKQGTILTFLLTQDVKGNKSSGE